MSYQSKHRGAFPQVQAMMSPGPRVRPVTASAPLLAEIGKPLFDKVFALAALLFLAPLLVIIAITLKLREGGPMLFAHERVGRDGARFRCLKFRTMVPDAEARLAHILATDAAARAEWETTRKLADDPRVSCLGRFLRRTSLDELPQFVNVLRGDMSIVGPRPVVAEELPRYGDHVSAYLSVKPGITGLWQVSGRSDTTFDERVALDAHYVRNRSFGLDLQIIWRTALVLLSQKGAR